MIVDLGVYDIQKMVPYIILFNYLFKQLVSRHNVNRTNKIYTEESQARISHAISKQSVYEIKMFSNYVWTKQELIGCQSSHEVDCSKLLGQKSRMPGSQKQF